MLTHSTEQKYQEVLQVAESLYRRNPDWVTFFREVLGIEGIARKSFPSLEQLTAFEKSAEFDAIQQMVVKLREKRIAADAESEPTRVITVRLPKSMHEYLRTEAHDLHTSMNKLCISKLLQVIGEDKIPNERTSGSSGSSSGSSSSGSSATAAKSGGAPANHQGANHQAAPQPGAPAVAGTIYSATASAPASRPQTPPFKPAQSRF